MKPAMKPAILAALVALLAVPAMAQPAAKAAAGTAPGTVAAAQATNAAAVAKHYAHLVQSSYDDTLASALTLQKAVQAFIDAPSDDGLKAARKAWLDAREFYGQTEAFRFYGGPIDDKNGPEGRINAWPMDEVLCRLREGQAQRRHHQQPQGRDHQETAWPA
jgi:putative iron-regulated protein